MNWSDCGAERFCVQWREIALELKGHPLTRSAGDRLTSPVVEAWCEKDIVFAGGACGADCTLGRLIVSHAGCELARRCDTGSVSLSVGA